jgi:hypothetical protein
MEEAHQYPGMVAYISSLLHKGDTAFPLFQLPNQVERSVRAALRGQPRDPVARIVHQFIRYLLDREELLDLLVVLAPRRLSAVAGLRGTQHPTREPLRTAAQSRIGSRGARVGDESRARRAHASLACPRD